MTDDASIDALCDRGWHLFPVGEDKQPRTPAGFYNSSDDAVKVKKMLADRRNVGLAVETGRRLGAFVVDCDNEAAVQVVLARGMPHTVETKTRRGRHYYLKCPRGKDLVVRTRPGILEKIDIKGDGGFAVIAPYFDRTWINSPLDTPFAEPPEWLLELLKPKQQPTGAEYKSRDRSTAASVSREEKYCLAALDAEARKLADQGENTRNAELNNAALKLGSLWHHGFFTEAEVRADLRNASIANGYIGEHGEAAFDATFSSGWGKGTSSPRAIPEGDHQDRGWDRFPSLGAAPQSKPAEQTPSGGMGEWDAGADSFDVPPRGWLQGNIWCRGFVSSTIADGGVGKTALKCAQALSQATGRPLVGEHVFHRCKVLLVSLEDDADEIRRRIKAAMIHYGIQQADIAGWLYLATPRGLVMGEMQDGQLRAGQMAQALRDTIKARGISVVVLDPFIKTHRLEENSNGVMDFITASLADIAMETQCAIDVPHHTSKGPADPGNANRGRGGSAMKDAARLVYTLSPMSEDEAQIFGIGEGERRRLVRLDSAKVNICPPAADAKWYRLLGVKLGNGTDDYPAGDEVQVVQPWTPPNVWSGLTHDTLNEILTEIDAGLPDGNRYSDAPKVDDRAAWRVVVRHYPDKSEGEARQVIKTWVKNGVLIRADYENPITRKPVKGLRVDNTKRPS